MSDEKRGHSLNKKHQDVATAVTYGTFNWGTCDQDRFNEMDSCRSSNWRPGFESFPR